MDSSEYRFINNLAVLIEYGRPLRESLANMMADEPNEELKTAYQAMIDATAKDGDFTAVLTDFPQICSRTSLALLKAARRSSKLTQLLPKLARLVRAKVEGELDPRQRFFETWALMVETGFSIDESLAELKHEFAHGPLGEVAEGLRSAALAGDSLSNAAKRFPEVFHAVSRDLLHYGQARDLSGALRAINRLV